MTCHVTLEKKLIKLMLSNLIHLISQGTIHMHANLTFFD